MSLASLMSQTVTLRRTTSVIRDAIGGTTTVQTSTTVSAYLEPVGSAGRSGEDLRDRNTGVGDFLLFLPATTSVTNWDEVVYDGRTFEIIAPPRLMPNPRTGNASHYELDLQEVQA